MSRFPALYQINTRIWLGEQSQSLGRPATFDDVPEVLLARLAEQGFEWVYWLGVWQTGPAGLAVSRSQPEWRDGFQQLLPNLTDADITGSPFAVQNYTVHRDFGGPEALARLRQRMHAHGLRLLVDYVPNHTAPDHAWVTSHPEFYVHGTPELLQREPANYFAVATRHGERILARGRDPFFPGWPDTAQLNYRHPGLRAAVCAELDRIAGQCDGVRCDMAMLLLPDVIARTWGDLSRPSDGIAPVDASFWPEAIAHLRGLRQGFLWMAEVYWEREWELQQQGFDYTYDKRLYDRLLSQGAGGVRAHLTADAEFQRRSVRFLENHDEPRAAAAFSDAVHPAAAVAGMLVPGLRFFHEGQLEGRRKHASVHLGRRPSEQAVEVLRAFYGKLLAVLKRPEVRGGEWRLVECRPAWEFNRTAGQVLAYAWTHADGSALWVVVNYGALPGQCYAQFSARTWHGQNVRLHDLMGTAEYLRSADEIGNRGLYLDLPAWGYHAFAVTPV